MAGTGGKKLSCTLGASTQIAADTYRVALICPELASSIEPGQFFDLAVPGNPAELLRLPFSYVQSNPQQGVVEMIYQVVGSGTTRLSQLPAGTMTDLIGPVGHGFDIPAHLSEGNGRIMLVGGGVGLAPLLGLAYNLAEMHITFDAVVATTTDGRLYGLDDLEAAQVGEVVITTDDGSAGIKGFASHGVEQLLRAKTYDLICCCGPHLMMRSVARLAEQYQIPCQISLETGMLCGIGCCMSCVIQTTEGPRGVCAAGPVFDAAKVVFDD